LADIAEQQPLVCIVDDAQWLDQASAQILAFVARRLVAERIALVCAARKGSGDALLTGLPELATTRCLLPERTVSDEMAKSELVSGGQVGGN
jgi:predicted ATPase